MLYRANDLRLSTLPAPKAIWSSGHDTPVLPERGAHIWLCPLTADSALLDFTTQEEKKRAENMLPESKAFEFLLSRGWLRAILAAYLPGTPPGEIRLERSAEGKPFLAGQGDMQFNLSHSQGLAAIGVAREVIGVDIEKLRPMPDWHSLAEGLLTNNTVAEILQLPVAEQAAGFLRAFTAREAQLKAFGFGFSGILQAMDFHSIVVDSHSQRNSEDRPVTDIHSYEQPIPLPEIDGYVGHVCLASAHPEKSL